ncbi:MAG: leucyl aminopeptidase, partial [Gammaproteobacteria bacterium]|nr:leucyl aminopeptidase [Gammaproteobacteria bacterium]MBT6949630.1 leucyl aminopeptidase [Gammaproteobacteria bacterium]MBT7531326.1 leucyl aminopeptidase [Gammaproteobacteria bacterium]MBT7799346.1 leucyl aminopeptidase [Gammaproteobacteria bacterium]
RDDISGKTNQTLLLHDVPNVGATRVLLVGLGNEKSMSSAKYADIARTVIGKMKATSSRTNLCCLLEVDVPGRSIEWKTQKIIESFEAGLYSFTKMKGKPPVKTDPIESVDLLLDDKSELETVLSAIAVGNALTAGISSAKTLGNLPGNICTPTYLANQAKQLAKDYSSITTKVIEEKEIAKLGMGAFMSVTRGSVQPGKLIVITHKGGKAKEAPHVLVGKGITFDTGGISLKPGGGMHEMIWDMCGAASVFGTMVAIAEQGLAMNVIGVIAAAENMPSGDASRPGDIVKTMSGQTVEILNTDAEGRLVLCDALTYIDQFNPKTVIDVATLTGACVIALGSHASAMYANDEGVAADLTKAGEDSLDRVWRMPLWEDYQVQINSAFADMANIGGREAGSITAACFLARFTKKYRWAHLDVAGSAFKGSGPSKGSTGRPVSLLFEYLNNLAA